MRTEPDLTLGARTGLPDALRVLADAYPRTGWESHAGFTGLVQFWMDRHLMFRDLMARLREDAAGYAAGDTDLSDYAAQLRRQGGLFLNELHGHHQIEDQHYFPRLIQLDQRVERGFELLEADHEAIDPLLHALAQGANSVLDGGEPGPFLDQLTGFAALLERHLTDEEDIVVPVILHSGFDG